MNYFRYVRNSALWTLTLVLAACSTVTGHKVTSREALQIATPRVKASFPNVRLENYRSEVVDAFVVHFIRNDTFVTGGGIYVTVDATTGRIVSVDVAE
jgi:hypothetical protein